MSAEAVEPSEATEEPLRLSCGHLLTAVVTSPEGTSFCGACADLAEIVQTEAEEEADSGPVEAVLVHEGAVSRGECRTKLPHLTRREFADHAVIECGDALGVVSK